MKKLKAIWQLIKADEWAIFTYEDVPENPEYLTAPYFRWNISSKNDYFINLILCKVRSLIKIFNTQQNDI